MEMRLTRIWYTKNSTIGMLFIDDKFECYTLEDMVRIGVKIYGRTAIPAGTYKVIISKSPRMNKITPEILDVPNFTGIRIHILNTADESEGCVGVGCDRGKDFIGRSKLAFDNLMLKLNNQNDIKITIIDNPNEVIR